MEVAPGILARTFTAPLSSHSQHNNSSQSSSATPNTYSTSSRPSRASGTTQDSSILLQGKISPPPQSNGYIEATNNVINRVAERESSLYQQCITLRNRLRKVPGFQEEYIQTVQQAAEVGETLSPVDALWKTFRRGYSLMLIYNALDTPHPVVVNTASKSQSKREKEAAYKFVEACTKELHIPQSECFMLSDLLSENTTGFVKVVNVVNRVVDMLVQHGKIDKEDSDSMEDERRSQRLSQGKRTQRQHIVDELVNTERTYVQHLEILQAFKLQVEQQALINGDAIHNIFLNLNNLLDVQRKFLISVEQENAKDEDEQNWGVLFGRYGETFQVYQPYIINQKTCEETAIRNFDKLSQVQGPPEMRQIVESPPILTGFLLKPFARLCKYPLLLKELAQKGELDEKKRKDIQEGSIAITQILDYTNSYMAKQEQQQIVLDLKDQVDDWKQHRVEAFGDLLQHGTFVVIKGDGQNTEREYRIYLFEKILLCCKEIGQSRKGKLSTKPTPAPTRNGKPRMALKGRIFMQNVTELLLERRPGKYALKLCSDTKIFWRGDETIEFFVIKFPSEEMMKKWSEIIEHQRSTFNEQARLANMTSQTEFRYLQDQGNLENPYKDDDDEDSFEYPDSAMSRQASSTSLRSRSATNDSMTQATNLRGGKHAPLTLRTQHLYNATSPMEQQRYGNSYFSPVAESPQSYSSRTSSSSGMMPLHSRQSGPLNGQSEDNNRFTAPPAGYAIRTSKDSPAGYYPVDPRTGRYVSPPQALSSRMRSASSPDVHTLNSSIRGAMSNAPPLPTLPQHLSIDTVNRSQNNSPLYSAGSNPRDGIIGPQYGGRAQTISPPLMSPASSFGDGIMPSSLRVKVKVPSEGSAMTLVVSLHITFLELQKRIDAKLQRHTKLSLADGTVKLKYLYDDEFVTIRTDEDVQTAFETWRDQQNSPSIPGQIGEIELYCHR